MKRRMIRRVRRDPDDFRGLYSAMGIDAYIYLFEENTHLFHQVEELKPIPVVQYSRLELDPANASG